MYAGGMMRRTLSITPPWLPPVLAALAVLVGLLTAFFEHGEFGHPSNANSFRWPSGLSLALIAATVAAWLAETGGLRWPRHLFTLAVVLPTSLLLYAGRDTFAPLFLMLLMSWVGYVGTRRERLLALGLAFVSIFPPLIARHGGYEDWVPWTFGLAASWSTASALAAQQRTLAALRAAQADLERYTELAPRANDLAAVREQLALVERLLAMRN